MERASTASPRRQTDAAEGGAAARVGQPSVGVGWKRHEHARSKGAEAVVSERNGATGHSGRPVGARICAPNDQRARRRVKRGKAASSGTIDAEGQHPPTIELQRLAGTRAGKGRWHGGSRVEHDRRSGAEAVWTERNGAHFPSSPAGARSQNRLANRRKCGIVIYGWSQSSSTGAASGFQAFRRVASTHKHETSSHKTPAPGPHLPVKNVVSRIIIKCSLLTLAC